MRDSSVLMVLWKSNEFLCWQSARYSNGFLRGNLSNAIIKVVVFLKKRQCSLKVSVSGLKTCCVWEWIIPLIMNMAITALKGSWMDKVDEAELVNQRQLLLSSRFLGHFTSCIPHLISPMDSTSLFRDVALSHQHQQSTLAGLSPPSHS